MENIKKKRNSWQLSGSLTVEASLVLPVFVFAVAGLLFFIQIFNIEQRVQFALTQTAWEASEYGFIFKDLSGGGKGDKKEGDEKEGGKKKEDEKEGDDGQETTSILRRLADGSFYSLTMEKYVDGEWLDRSCVLGGYSGLSFYGSEFMEDGESIKIVAAYRVKIPFPIFSFLSFPIRQQVYSRAFIGSNDGLGTGRLSESGENEKEEEEVYITETGTKYHRSTDCTYLKPSISCVDFGEVADRRNNSGAKYYACERCMSKGGEPALCYITEDGTRYHGTVSCPGLKRTVSAISLKKAERMGKTPCSKCGKR